MDDTVTTRPAALTPGPLAAGAPAIRVAPRIAATSLVQALPPATRYILRGGPDVMAAAGKVLGLTISQTACRAAVNASANSLAPPATRSAVPEIASQASAVSRAQAAAFGTPDATNDGGLAALWLGPDEQLLLGPAGCDIAAALEPALRDLPHSLVEVSHRQTALRVSGPQATLLLNAGCPLDLDPSAFPVGMCTRTVLAKAEIVLWRTDHNVFHVEVWRSFAAYVSSFLAEVARELEP